MEVTEYQRPIDKRMKGGVAVLKFETLLTDFQILLVEVASYEIGYSVSNVIKYLFKSHG